MYTAITEELANDPWIKLVGMLQQNWAVVVEQDQTSLVVFYNDLCAVFDEISFPSTSEAEAALRRNGFSKYRENPGHQEFIALPEGDFVEGSHPSGQIYSSGQYWR